MFYCFDAPESLSTFFHNFYKLLLFNDNHLSNL